MLNQYLRAQISQPEVRLIYDSRMRLSNYAIRKEIADHIKAIRTKHNNAAAQDPLLVKLTQYGNKSGWYKQKVKELEQVIYDVTKTVPNAFLGEYRSIEFEVIFKNQNSLDAFVKDVRAKGYSKCVTVKNDGSLRADEGDPEAFGKEVVVMYKSGEEVIVETVCALLKTRAYINNSCGTHVHFDMRNVDEAKVKQYGRRIARCVPVLKMLLPKSRRTSQYCTTPINELKNVNNRYAFVNLEAYLKYKTIEIRGHSATIKADKILNWIKICEKIMLSSRRSRSETISDPNELIKLYKFDGELAKYIEERYRKFNPKREIPAATTPPVPIPHPPAGVFTTTGTFDDWSS
jgi:hypothetical protein